MCVVKHYCLPGLLNVQLNKKNNACTVGFPEPHYYISIYISNLNSEVVIFLILYIRSDTVFKVIKNNMFLFVLTLLSITMQNLHLPTTMTLLLQILLLSTN